jgi:hypothetical protein
MVHFERGWWFSATTAPQAYVGVGAIRVLANLRRLGIGCDGDVDASAFFELHIVAIFVGQAVFYAQISIAVVRAADGYLRLFWLVRTRRRDNFIDGTGEDDSWVLWSSRRIQIAFGDSRGSGHARFRYFPQHVGTRRATGCFLGALTDLVFVEHAFILAPRANRCSPVWHSCEDWLRSGWEIELGGLRDLVRKRTDTAAGASL